MGERRFFREQEIKGKSQGRVRHPIWKQALAQRGQTTPRCTEIVLPSESSSTKTMAQTVPRNSCSNFSLKVGLMWARGWEECKFPLQCGCTPRRYWEINLVGCDNLPKETTKKQKKNPNRNIQRHVSEKELSSFS